MKAVCISSVGKDMVLKLPPHASLVVVAARPTWVRVEGAGLLPDPRCLAKQRLGDGPQVLVGLGEGVKSWRWRTINVEDGQIGWAREKGWDYVAALVVAQGRFRNRVLRVEVDTGVLEAMARWLVLPPAGTLPFLAVDEESIEEAAERIATCGGWQEALKKGCVSRSSTITLPVRKSNTSGQSLGTGFVRLPVERVPWEYCQLRSDSIFHFVPHMRKIVLPLLLICLASIFWSQVHAKCGGGQARLWTLSGKCASHRWANPH